MATIMTATDARKNFFNVLKAAGKPGRTITITLGGEPPVIMMSADEFEGWIETMEIMSDPDLVRQLRQAKKEKGKGMITLEELMQEEQDRKLHVQRHSRTAGKKAVSKAPRKRSGTGARGAARAGR